MHGDRRPKKGEETRSALAPCLFSDLAPEWPKLIPLSASQWITDGMHILNTTRHNSLVEREVKTLDLCINRSIYRGGICIDGGIDGYSGMIH